MAVFERSVSLRAPLDEVWAFHTTVEGLEAVTPGWLDLRLESHRRPDGESGDGELLEGSEVTLSIRPLGVGPRQRWTSRIIRRERSDDRGEFIDEMIDGPFPKWQHTHRFESIPEGTRLTDRVEYELPLGPASGLSGLGWPGFAAVFAQRHRATKRRLE
jgi:ligand-binding SRPBCC domain-containing protein